MYLKEEFLLEIGISKHKQRGKQTIVVVLPFLWFFPDDTGIGMRSNPLEI